MKSILISMLAVLITQTAMADYTPNGAVRSGPPECTTKAQAVKKLGLMMDKVLVDSAASKIVPTAVFESETSLYVRFELIGARNETDVPQAAFSGTVSTSKDCSTSSIAYGTGSNNGLIPADAKQVEGF